MSKNNKGNKKNKSGERPVNKLSITPSNIRRLSNTHISLYSQFSHDEEASDSDEDLKYFETERNGYAK